MTERPPGDEGNDDLDREPASPPPGRGDQDTFEREIEGELSELRDELGIQDEWGHADEFAATPFEEPQPTVEPEPQAEPEQDLEQAPQPDEPEPESQPQSEFEPEPTDDAGQQGGEPALEGDDVAADPTESPTGGTEAAEQWDETAAHVGDGQDPEGTELDASEADLDLEPVVEGEPVAEPEHEAGDGAAAPAETQEADALDGPELDETVAPTPGATVPGAEAGAGAAAVGAGTPEGVAAGAAAGAPGGVPAAAGTAAATATAVGGAYTPVAEIDLELESERRPVAMWAKFLAGSMLVVVSIATAVSVTILLGLTDLASGIYDRELLGDVAPSLQTVEPGEPQTILLLGSDQRAGDIGGRSDTAMLLRLDPDNGAISLFALPRDLRVNIPGRGVDRLNAAYAFGGPQLALKTIQQLTGLDVNHIVNLDFEGFAKAVDAVDCAYVDVDRDYFNDNSSGGDRYSAIDINAGYQRLCGDKALQYVRFRHTDNDIVRGARQQDFIREARPKIPTGDLVLGGLLPGLSSGRGEELIEIFKEHTSSDIRSANQLLEVLNLLVASRDSQFNEIRFEGELGGTYVTASNEQMQLAVDQFLGEKPPKTDDEAATSAAAGDASGSANKKAERKAKKKRDSDPTSGVDLVNTGEEGRRFAEIVDEAGTLGIAVKYPTRLPPGATISEDSRGYLIKDPDEVKHASYKLVMSQRGPGITEYFGVTGTPWKDAPILDHPSETREIDGTVYQLYFAGDRLRMIAWETELAAYWVSNTLLQSLTEQQMIAIATSTGTFR